MYMAPAFFDHQRKPARICWRWIMLKQEDNKRVLDDSNLQTIADMLKDIKYGSVNIIVQDGKIIQIDKTEKIRMKN